MYDPSFTHDEEMQKFRSIKINRNNTVYTIKSFCWVEQQDYVFIHLKDDKSHFGLKLYRNRENVRYNIAYIRILYNFTPIRRIFI